MVKTLGQLIVAHKRETGRSNEKIAANIGTSGASVSRWARDQVQNVDPDWWGPIADELGLSVEDVEAAVGASRRANAGLDEQELSDRLDKYQAETRAQLEEIRRLLEPPPPDEPEDPGPPSGGPRRPRKRP